MAVAARHHAFKRTPGRDLEVFCRVVGPRPLDAAPGLMTKNVATVEGLDASALIARLQRFGFGLQCPDTGHVVGFSCEGEGPLQLASDEVVDFLVDGNGVLLWRGASESLYMSCFAGKPRIFFDGFTADEEESFCNDLSESGVRFSLSHEDEA